MAQSISDKVLYRQLAVVAHGVIRQRASRLSMMYLTEQGFQLEGVLFGITSWCGNTATADPAKVIAQRLSMLKEGLEAFKEVVPPWVLESGSIGRLQRIMDGQHLRFRASGNYVHHTYLRVSDKKHLESTSTSLVNDLYVKSSYIQWATDEIQKVDVPAPKRFPPKFRKMLSNERDPLASDPLVMESLCVDELEDASAIWIAQQILNESGKVGIDKSNGTIRILGNNSAIKDTALALIATLREFVVSNTGVVQHMSLAWEDFSKRVTTSVAFPSVSVDLNTELCHTHWMAATALGNTKVNKVGDLQRVLQMVGAPISSSIWKLKQAMQLLEEQRTAYEELARRILTTSVEVHKTYKFDPSYTGDTADVYYRLLGYWIESTLLDVEKVSELMMLSQTADDCAEGAESHYVLRRLATTLPQWLRLLGDPEFLKVVAAESKRLLKTK